MQSEVARPPRSPDIAPVKRALTWLIGIPASLLVGLAVLAWVWMLMGGEHYAPERVKFRDVSVEAESVPGHYRVGFTMVCNKDPFIYRSTVVKDQPDAEVLRVNAPTKPNGWTNIIELELRDVVVPENGKLVLVTDSFPAGLAELEVELP